MPGSARTETELLGYVEARSGALVELIQKLVAIPSENTPPTGAEGACQRFAADFLRDLGFTTDQYELDEAPGLREHPLYWPGRDYRGRPNVAGVLPGSGYGRSLILSGHIDTVPRGSALWRQDPFGGAIDGNRLYGRGSNDMKAGIATNLFVAQAVRELDLPLRGSLTVESVVDEEFGGVNGTLAGRLRGYTADAAVISEPSFLRVCPAQRGGLTAHLTFEVANEGILSSSRDQGAAALLGHFLQRLPEFAQLRRATAPPHPAYAHLENPVPVSVLKIHSGPWGMDEPMATAGECRVEFFWQAMPGEEHAAVKAQFEGWLRSMAEERKDLFPAPPRVEYPLRWLPGSSCDSGSELVRELSGCAEAALGAKPAVQGIEGPCDMYIFHQAFGMPAVLWGARGGNTHQPDEYVEIDSVIAAAKALLLFVHRWCG
jgi:acetylornithine deacetylase